MGGSTFKSADWDNYAAKTSRKSASAIFTQDDIHADLNPLNFDVREARDSDAHPESTPVIVGVDVTGSMGSLSENLVKKGIGVVFSELLSRKPITDPQLAVVAIGDVMSDDAPLQASQFESGMEITEQTEKVWLEGGGGGNSCESYDLAYYFGAYMTSTDSMEKRGKKGFLFTLGDELPPKGVSRGAIKKFIGDTPETDLSFADVLADAQKSWHCFHLIVAQGNGVTYMGLDRVKSAWRDLMGQNVVVLKNIDDLSETIVSIIQVIEGEAAEDVAASWSGSTAVTVREAIKDLPAKSGKKSGKGVAKL